MTMRSRDEALRTLEQVRADYLAKARGAALLLGSGGRAITVDDVRKVCPPPKEIDGRVMGAIFYRPFWEAAGFVNSSRRTCHKRPIRLFRIRQR